MSAPVSMKIGFPTARFVTPATFTLVSPAAAGAAGRHAGYGRAVADLERGLVAGVRDDRRRLRRRHDGGGIRVLVAVRILDTGDGEARDALVEERLLVLEAVVSSRTGEYCAWSDAEYAGFVGVCRCTGSVPGRSGCSAAGSPAVPRSRTSAPCWSKPAETADCRSVWSWEIAAEFAVIAAPGDPGPGRGTPSSELTAQR